MSKPLLDGTLCISRPQSTSDNWEVRMTLKDELSRSDFLQIKISPEELMLALTGLSSRPVKFKLENMQRVGKQKQYENARLELPRKLFKSTYDKTELRAWLAANAQKEGWEIDDYLGSQGSIIYQGDNIIINFGYSRYVDIE